jgi:hypothetical protein
MKNNYVAALVYKFNPKAIWVIVVYCICAIWFLFSLFSLSTAEIGIIGGILFLFPVLVRNGFIPAFKLRTWDERKLIFSTEGIEFGDDIYPLKSLETAAFFLDSLNGFEYRVFAPPRSLDQSQYSYNKADGDESKISFRYKGEVTDFTFCLENYADYCACKAVAMDWASQGVNVVLKQSFSDDFILNEMEYYKTPSGLPA